MVKATNLLSGLVLVMLLGCIYFLPVSHALKSSDELFYNAQISSFLRAVRPVQSIFNNPTNSNGITAEMDCLLCVFGLRLVEQLAVKEEVPVETVLHNLCKKLGKEMYVQTCDLAISLWGPEIIKLFNSGTPIDIICQHKRINMCKNHSCSLYPKTAAYQYNMYYQQKAKIENKNKGIPRPPLKILSPSEFKAQVEQVGSYFQKFAEKKSDHLPKVDGDLDGFSEEFGSRGWAWRGKDCAPGDAKIYPGRKNGTASSRGDDFNCNGIFGFKDTKKTWKEELCPESLGLSGRGIGIIGDSVGARFRFPEQYFLAANISWDLIGKIPDIIENEADFPEMSWGTGFDTSDSQKLINPGPVNSLYLEMRKRNRCSHRDYQNIAFNGGKSIDFVQQANELKRDPKLDNPMTLIVEFVGNDVCSKGDGSRVHYTPVEEFYRNIMAGLRILDKKLPPNSYLVFIGVADGRFLWDALHDQIHPLGTPYPYFYSFLTCNKNNPCGSWLVDNSTLRDQTSRHAELLSSVYEKLIEEHQSEFKNFKMLYIANPVVQIMKDCALEKDCVPAQLIEATDGFHPGQKMQPRMAKYFIAPFLKENPNLLGVENPNNALIEKLFGDQGGH